MPRKAIKKKVVEEEAPLVESKPILTDDRIDLKNIKGIGPAVRERLIKSGIEDALSLATCTPETLVIECNVDRKKAGEILEANLEYLRKEGFVRARETTGKDDYERRKTLKRITTSSKALDSLLGGASGPGLETEAVTEVFGEFGSGKTQICLTLCVNVQRPEEMGGLNAKAVWIDTERTFRPERIAQMAEARKLDVDLTLNNIILYQPYNAAHMEMHINEIPKLLQRHDIKLIVVDSVIALYRAEFTGMGNLAVRQQRISKLMKKLLDIATIYKIAVVITNQVMSSPGTMFGDPTKPTGGHVLGHASTYRVYLRKAGDNRVAKMIDSPEHAYSDVKFSVDETGIIDAKVKKEEEEA